MLRALPARVFAARLFTLALLVSGVACSLLVDTSEIDAGCGTGMKYCDDKCVSVDEPFYGCEPSGCEPCGDDHEVTDCEAGRCIFVACVHGWGCAGCIKSLFTDRENCGTCGNECMGELSCRDGVCVPPGAGFGGAGGEGGSAP